MQTAQASQWSRGRRAGSEEVWGQGKRLKGRPGQGEAQDPEQTPRAGSQRPLPHLPAAARSPLSAPQTHLQDVVEKHQTRDPGVALGRDERSQCREG